LPASTVTTFPASDAINFPRGIVIGGDGNFWYTNYDEQFVAPAGISRLTPAGAWQASSHLANPL
jgi:hypothetical protein